MYSYAQSVYKFSNDVTYYYSNNLIHIVINQVVNIRNHESIAHISPSSFVNQVQTSRENTKAKR